MSIFPDDEGNELSAILSELQEESSAVSHDQGDKVMKNVEGTVPEQTVVQKSDYDRMVEKTDEQFIKERNERREEQDRMNQQAYQQLRDQIRAEQDEALLEFHSKTRNQCIQRIDQSAKDLRVEVESVKAEAESMMLKTGEKMDY